MGHEKGQREKLMRKNMLLEMMGTSLLALALAAPASAETVYRWTAADGSLAFTDDAKRIPAQYRAKSKRSQSGDLANYGRYTPTKASAESTEARLAARLERLRAFNAGGTLDAATAAAPQGSGAETILQLDNRTSISIPNDQLADEDPIVVEERRVRDRNNATTTHVTVVRQGDRVLSIVRPESSSGRADWPTEEELLAGDLD
jgi:hypothetical protein